MRTSLNRLVAPLAIAFLALVVPSASRAEVIMYVYQSGSNVVASASGTLDITDLTDGGGDTDGPVVWGSIAALSVGPKSSSAEYYDTLSGPSSFGAGGQNLANSGSGDFVCIYGDYGALEVNSGYVSGSSLSGTSTWNNTTLSNLGLTTGQYTYTWGTGADADSLVVNIGTAPTAVPEPASLAMVAAGLGLAGVAAIRRRRRAATA